MGEKKRENIASWKKTLSGKRWKEGKEERQQEQGGRAAAGGNVLR